MCPHREGVEPAGYGGGVALTALPIALDPICRLIGSARVDLTNEKATQADIHQLLTAHLPADVEVEREFSLTPADRPDFLIAGAVVIEVKVKRSDNVLTVRQLGRYAADPRVQAIILASNRAISLPAEINGKPARFVSLGRGWM